VIVDDQDVRLRFGEYLSVFAACGRGEAETAALLAYYGVPLLVTRDAGGYVLTRDDEVLATLRQQVEGMRAAGYDRSEILAAEVVILNSASALSRGRFSRQRSDGGEIGRRIAVLAVESA
jgi:hypothetical protein